MAENTIRKYYPAAVKKSPYVILDPSEYSSMMAEEYVKYTDPDLTKMKSFSRLAKYIVVGWFLLAMFVLIHQSFYRDTVVYDGKSNSFVHNIRYIFSGNSNKKTESDKLEKESRIMQGLEKCTPGAIYKPDNCNICNCYEDGQLACTKMLCMDIEKGSFVIE